MLSNLQDLLEATKLSDVVIALGGPPVRHGRCAAWWRDGRNPTSVAIDDLRGVWCDHGEGESGGVLALIERAHGCSRAEAAKWLATQHGMTLGGRRKARGLEAAPVRLRAERIEPDDRNRIEQALQIWDESHPLIGTPGETYLQGRGLGAHSLDHAVRFHRAAPWESSRRPCLVAQLRDIVTGDPCGVHRTVLDASGHKVGRRMLGRAKGAAIKLSADEDVTLGLGVCEGIEDGLAIMQCGRWRPVWALLSAGGIARLPVLGGIEHLTIFADADHVGEEAALAAAERWSTAGIEVAIRRPATPGSDYGDLAGARI